MVSNEKLTLKFDEFNANQGTERGKKLLKESLEQLGAGRGIVCDRNGVVLGGNKTLEQAQELGIPVEYIHTSGDRLVVTVRDDLDLEEDDRARLLAFSDNRISELSLSWDSEILQTDIDLLSITNLWNETELALVNDNFDLASFEGMAGEPAKEDKKRVEVEKTGEQSDLLPFHVLLSQEQRERLFLAINEVKSKHGLETTAEALDAIVQDYLK